MAMKVFLFDKNNDTVNFTKNFYVNDSKTMIDYLKYITFIETFGGIV
jgi:hypothetical protein